MKYRLISTFMAVLMISATAVAADLKDGFLDIPWGTALAGLKQLTKARENGKFGYYVNPTRVHVINDIKIPKVVYGFYEDRFFAVYLDVEDISVHSRFKGYLISKYGNPETSLTMKNEQRTYKWKYGKVKMKLKEPGKSGQMKLAIYYTPISRQVNEAQQETFYDNSFRLFPVDKNRTPEMIPLLNF